MAASKNSGVSAGPGALRNHLLREIAENRIPPGGQLPTERSLMDQFSLGRSAVRRVLSDLSRDGIVQRHQGRGTFRIGGTQRRPSAMLVGVWFNWPAGPHWSPMANGIREELARNDYHCVMETGGLETGDERRGIESLLHKNLDGFIIAPSSNRNEEHGLLAELIQRRRPLVLVERRPYPTCQADLVCTHRELGAREVVEHLISLGHRRIAYFGIESILAGEDERMSGYQKTMGRYRLAIDDAWIKVHRRLSSEKVEAAPAGTSPSVFVTSAGTRVSYDDCARSVDELLGLPVERRPTAVFAINDDTARVLIALVQQRGLRVPGDISVAGFSDPRDPQDVERQPMLTTYAEPVHSIGELAASRLLQRIQNPRDAMVTILLQGRLVPGATTAPPQAATGGPGV